MDETIRSRIQECSEGAELYDRWLRRLRLPNVFLVGGGSLLSFLGGAAIIAEKFPEYAGIMALVGGALTGVHAWFGCEAHQEKCRTIEAQYSSFRAQYETLRATKDFENEKKRQFDFVEKMYADFIGKKYAKPWM